MFHFYVSKKKYETKTQTSVYNAVNDLHYEIKFKNCVKNKNNFFIKGPYIKNKEVGEVFCGSHETF